jgi:hypothetical protein
MADYEIVNPAGFGVYPEPVVTDATLARFVFDPGGYCTSISGISVGSATSVYCAANHGLVPGQQVNVQGISWTGLSGLNPSSVTTGTFTATVLTGAVFSIPVNTTGGTPTISSTSASVVGWLPVGTLVAIQPYTGVSSTSRQAALSPTYPIVNLAGAGAASTTASANVIGVTAGGNAVATTVSVNPQCVSPGAVATVTTGGMVNVLVGQTVSAGHVLVTSTAGPGLAGSNIAGSGSISVGTTWGTVLQNGTGTSISPGTAWVYITS